MHVNKLLISLFLCMSLVSFGYSVTFASNMPSDLQLSSDFTLKYKSVLFDTRTTKVKNENIKQATASYKDMVHQHLITMQQAGKYINDIKKSNTLPSYPQIETVTISSKNDKVIFIREGISYSGKKIAIYDGHQTYYSSVQHGNAPRLYDGFSLVDVFPCPFPGLGLPHLPLINGNFNDAGMVTIPKQINGEVPEIDIAGNTPTMKAGSITVISENGFHKVLKAQTYIGEQLTTEWNFHSHQRLGDYWIANSMTWTSQTYLGPTSKCDFELISASTKSLPDEQFDPATWLANGSTISYQSGDVNIGFAFNPGSGSLSYQADIAMQRIIASHARIDNGNIAARSRSGLFLLIAIGLVCVASILVKFRRHRVQ